ncbi:chaperone protein dnaJ 49-like [Cynara cardunculus var. scolymus]|uniref:DnaJ domain-containing protein n=1 Tax=Cynara cardunculus var. scolymus TaxID=59895 RepID=A0A118JVZ5_CYNCS|nr:chaperone protein dnaJ 49-like [Cynara cardunculus var. scolymus]KVH93787.1 DnaJ domain-containing protein [Cynara cardunculus var. scolymus]
MDGNKDDALRCLKIGKDALGLGDRARALKFISKAHRLDPSLPVDDLLSKLEGDNTGNESPSASSSSKPSETGAGDSSGIRHRVPATGSSSGSGVYTEEQVTIVREIRRKKDYYEILGLEKACSVEDVRKSYRKLSLRVHPDKNKAPGSEEAFKKVSKAFQCLSVDENRKQYDLVGSDEPVYERRTASRGAHHHGFSNGFYYDGDVDADEIFRNFFFGGMNPAATTQFTGFRFGPGMGAPAGNGSAGIRTLIQLLPVLLILLLNFLPSNEPIYSLSRSYGYEHRLSTQKGIVFFVKSANFEQDYPLNSPERSQLEEKIEHEYVSILSHNCRLEMQRIHWGYQQETPNCDMLKQFKALT